MMSAFSLPTSSCGAAGSEVAVMSSPDIDTWLPRVRLLSVETHDFFDPAASSTVAVRRPLI